MFGSQVVSVPFQVGTPRAIRSSPKLPSSVGESLRPHLGGIRDPGSPARLGVPGHSAQLSKWPADVGVPGGCWKLKPRPPEQGRLETSLGHR